MLTAFLGYRGIQPQTVIFMCCTCRWSDCEPLIPYVTYASDCRHCFHVLQISPTVDHNFYMLVITKALHWIDHPFLITSVIFFQLSYMTVTRTCNIMNMINRRTARYHVKATDIWYIAKLRWEKEWSCLLGRWNAKWLLQGKCLL